MKPLKTNPLKASMSFYHVKLNSSKNIASFQIHKQNFSFDQYSFIPQLLYAPVTFYLNDVVGVGSIDRTFIEN